MKHLTTPLRYLTAGLLLAAAWICAGQAARGADSPDQAFVTEAAQGGLSEVDLGHLAVKQAKSKDVKSFGQHMIDDHSRANDELKQLAAKKKWDLPKDVGAENKATMDRLSKLSGEAFDKAYMSDMVEDHVKDVSAFEKEARSAKDPDLKAWAGKTLPTLRHHLSMAREAASKVGAKK
jgi:putative membrane protein